MHRLDRHLSKQVYTRLHASPVGKHLTRIGAFFAIQAMIVLVLFMANAMQAVVLLVVMVSVWLLTCGTQFAVGRRRPFECETYVTGAHILCRTPSFPSAHASVSFAIAATAFVLGMPFVWALCLIAAWIAFSRVAVGVHYVGDVIVGSIFGSVVAAALIWYVFLF